MNEGVATYFGASVLDHRGLHTGQIDSGAYPVWWLAEGQPSGNLQADIDAGRIIPLHALLEGTGPDFNSAFNQYYVQYWSLTHFLFHARNGRHAAGFKRVISEGSSIDAFERHIGPLTLIETEWYIYHLGLVRRAREGRLHGTLGPGSG